MHEQKRYKKMTIFVEACYSGSLGENLEEKYNVYMMTASNQYLTSKATHCFEDAVMKYENGKPVSDPWEEGNCLNDLFSWNWMQELKTLDPETTLDTFFEKVRNDTKTTPKVPGSPVSWWGSKKVALMKVSDFLGASPDDSTQTSSLGFFRDWIKGKKTLAQRRKIWLKK